MFPSRLALQNDHQERHATWLEAFYDLVFVFIINTLIYHVEQNPTVSQIGLFLVMLLPAWWLWVDFSYYFDQFGDNDPVTRICLFVSMLLILYMGLIVLNIAANAQYFNIVYGLQRCLITLLYLRAYHYVPAARSTTGPFAISFILSLSLWSIALFISGPIKFVLWGVALAIEILNGPIVYSLVRNPPKFVSHMPERFGVFLIIILGETILTVAAGLKHVALSPTAVVTSILSFIIAINIWWLYFSRVNDEHITQALHGTRKTLLASYVYGYGHFFIYSGIGLIGSGILLCFDTASSAALPFETRVIVSAGLILYLTALYVVQRTSHTGFSTLYTFINIGLVVLFISFMRPAVNVSANSLLSFIAFPLSLFSFSVWKTDIEKPDAIA